MPREAASSWFREEDKGLHQCIRASSWCCCVGEEEEEGKTSSWCCCVGVVAVLGKKKKIEAKRSVAGEEEETEGRGLGRPGQEV